jgi:hypothetical protein
MSLRIKGKIIKILAEQKGTSARGEWKKQDFVVESTEDQFPKKICFTLFNDKTTSLNGLTPGSDVEVFFNIESREFNEKWYHNINAFRVERVNEQTSAVNPPPYTPADIPPVSQSEEGDDLPF